VSEHSWPWPAGAATGVGSLPGTDVTEALRVVLGELPDFPHLPELPERGPGAELVGRGAGLLAELPVALYAARWRLAAHPGRDLRRVRDLRERDLDELTAQAADYAGPFKVQAAGPWTLAAGVELPGGGPVLRDQGATRDVAASLAEGLSRYVAQVRARMPRATVVVQLDEPSLPAVLAGRVPTESGFGTLRAVAEATAADALREVIEAAGVPVVAHCCAPGVPVALLRSAGAAVLALDLDLVADLDPLGEAIDGGMGLLAGAAPTRPPTAGHPPSSAEVADRVRELWHRLGFPAARLPEQVVVTPACGLAGASPEYARAVLKACRDAGRRLRDDAHP
jgi:methionine synthase II (cobalamin-independent)